MSITTLSQERDKEIISMAEDFDKIYNEKVSDASSLDSLFDKPVDGNGESPSEFYYTVPQDSEQGSIYGSASDASKILFDDDASDINYDDEEYEEYEQETVKKKNKKKDKAAKGPKEPKKKSKIVPIIAGVLVLALLAGVYFYFFAGKKFDVSFVDDAGKVIETVKVKEGKTVELIEAPKKEGYVFIEWQLNGKKYDPTTLVGSDFELKAFYKKAMKVTFLYEDGTEFKVVEVGEGDTVEKPDPDPEVKNKAFVTWLTEEGKVFSFLTEIKEDIVLKAKMRDYIKPTGLAYANPTYRIYVREEKDLPAVVTPGNTTETVTYESSDPTIFTVDALGKVTGLKAGTATLTAKVEGFTATTTITVEEKPVTGLTVQEGRSVKLGKGKTITLHPVIVPEDATNKDVTFRSDNEEIATVSREGVVTGKKNGKCMIIARSNNGIEYPVEVEVYTAVDRIELNVSSPNTTLAHGANSSITITATIYPEDADVKTVEWQYLSGGLNNMITPSENGNTLTITTNDAFTGEYVANMQISATADGVECANPVIIYIEPMLVTTYVSAAGGGGSYTAAVEDEFILNTNIDCTLTVNGDIFTGVSITTKSVTGTVSAAGTAVITATTPGGQTLTVTLTAQ